MGNRVVNAARDVASGGSQLFSWRRRCFPPVGNRVVNAARDVASGGSQLFSWRRRCFPPVGNRVVNAARDVASGAPFLSERAKKPVPAHSVRPMPSPPGTASPDRKRPPGRLRQALGGTVQYPHPVPQSVFSGSRFERVRDGGPMIAPPPEPGALLRRDHRCPTHYPPKLTVSPPRSPPS